MRVAVFLLYPKKPVVHCALLQEDPLLLDRSVPTLNLHVDCLLAILECGVHKFYPTAIRPGSSESQNLSPQNRTTVLLGEEPIFYVVVDVFRNCP